MVKGEAEPIVAEDALEPKKVFTDEEERKIQDDAFERVDNELQKIFGKIQEKAEFMIKL